MPKLHFYYSAMNAGKSTMLISSAHNYHELGYDTIIFIPHIVGKRHIESRMGISKQAIPILDNTDIFEYVSSNRIGNTACILVDEAQFLRKRDVEALSMIVCKLEIPVLAYGLRTDYMGNLFEGSMYLLAWADIIIELKTICKCGRKATMNIKMDSNDRILKEGDQIETRDSHRIKYISVCRKCWLETNNCK